MKPRRFTCFAPLGLWLAFGCGRTEPELGLSGVPVDGIPVREDGGVGGPRDLGCTPKLHVESLTVLPIDDRFATAIASPGTVTYLETRGDFGRLERFDLVSGRASRIADGQVQLIDAAPRRTLFAQVIDGQSEVMIENEGQVERLFEPGSTYYGYGGEPRRQLSGALAAFCGGEGASVNITDLETGVRYGSLAQEGIPCAEPLFIEDRHVVYIGPPRDSLNAIMVFEANFGGPVPVSMVWGANLAMPVLFQKRIYYLTDGRFSSRALSYVPDAPVTTHSDSACSVVHASNSGVVAACGTEVTTWPYAATSEILFHDGRELRSLRAPMEDGRAILLPRLGDGFVTWLAFEDAEDLCDGRYEGPAGHVMAAALPDGPPIQVAPIMAGCFCCGAVWPNPMLDAEGDTLAWNYDAQSGTPNPREAGFGAARVVLGCE